jgi:hypothetical protein
LGIDWYINQLRYTVNKSPGLDVIFTPEQIEGRNREYMSYSGGQPSPQSPHYDLRDVLNQVAKPVIDQDTKRDGGPRSFPVAKLGVPVDTAAVLANGTVNPGDRIISPMLFQIPDRTLQRGLYRSDLIILSIIATNQWKRPIYFTSPYGDLGFWGYLRKDGLAYRLIPVVSTPPNSKWVLERKVNEIEQRENTGIGGTQLTAMNTDTAYDNLINKYRFGGADKDGVYFDEENRRHMLNIRSVFGELAGIMADNGDKDKAKKLLEKAEANIKPENMPYAMTSRFNSHNQTALLYLEAAYKAGMPELAEKIRLAVRKDLEQQQQYYNALRENSPELYKGLEGAEVFLNNIMLEVLGAIEQNYAPQVAKPQPNAPVERPGNVIINNPADSGKKNDSVK